MRFRSRRFAPATFTKSLFSAAVKRTSRKSVPAFRAQDQLPL